MDIRTCKCCKYCFKVVKLGKINIADCVAVNGLFKPNQSCEFYERSAEKVKQNFGGEDG